MRSPETTPHPAPSEPTDHQLCIPFWTDRDPNLRCLPVSFFKVDARMLGELLNNLALPSRPSNEVELHITTNMLTARVQDVSGLAWIQGSVRLEGDATIDLDGLTIVADRLMLTRLGNILRGPWSFQFDRNAHELSWTNETYKAQCNAVERLRRADVRPMVSDRVSGKLLADSIQYATTLRPRRVQHELGPHGARICNGFAMGGNVKGTSRAVSAEIPKALDIGIPHDQLKNAIHILKALKGGLSITCENDAIVIESVIGEFRGGWSSGEANWPKELGAVFSRHEPLISVRLSASELCGRIALFGAFPTHLQTVCFDLETQNGDKGRAKLVMTGVFDNLPWQCKLSADLRRLIPGSLRNLADLRFSASDLAKATLALTNSAEIEVHFGETGLTVQAHHAGAVRTTVLPGLSAK